MFDYAKFNPVFFSEIFKTYPELLALLSEGIDATHDYQVMDMAPWAPAMYEAAQKTAGLAKKLGFTLEIAPNKRSTELERTMLGMLSALAVSQQYFNFFKDTPTMFGEHLSEEQFKEIHELLACHFPKNAQKILFHELMMGDFGKIRSLRASLGSKFKIEVQDPDHFMSALLKQDDKALVQLFPSLGNFKESELLELRLINTGFHLGHFAHAESTERELLKLKAVIDKHGVAYLYKHILVQLFDVAGAAAQDGGKILLNKTIASAYLKSILPTLLELKDHTAVQVYHNHLVKKLKICKILPQQSVVNKLTPSERMLARLLLMFRVDKESAAQVLQQSLEVLSDDQTFVENIQQLNNYQSIPELQTPTYLPAILNGLKNSPRIMELAVNQKDNPQTIALRVGFQLIANVLQAHAKGVESGLYKAHTPVNFNGLTGLVKSDFRAIKNLCRENEFMIGKDGIAYQKPDTCSDEFKSSDESKYSDELKRSQAATAIQFWYRRIRDKSKVPKMLEIEADSENSVMAKNIEARRNARV